MYRLVLSVMFAFLFVLGEVTSAGDKHPPQSFKQTVSFARRMLQGYSFRVWISNQMAMGLQAWDAQEGNGIPVDPHFGMEYPVGSGIEHLFGAGIRIGGIVRGVRRVDEGYNGQDARKEFLPEYHHLPREHFWRTSVGASERATAPDSIGYSGYYFNHHIIVDRRGCDNDNDGKINEDDLDGMDNDGDWNPATDDVGSDGLPDSLEVSCDGIPYDPVSNPDPAGDNFDPADSDKCHPNPDGSWPLKANPDVWTEKNGIPDHGEPHVDEDYGAVSDNDLYCSATDTFRTPVIAGHKPMGIKVVQKSYAWKGRYAQCILPFDYYFINSGRNEIRDVWVGFFADMDIGPVNEQGYMAHNYSAYADSLRLVYSHNPIDRGSTPAGIILLKTPRPLDSLMYAFRWWEFIGRLDIGVNDSLEYSWMSGEGFPGSPIMPNQEPTDLRDTKFWYSFGPFAAMQPRDTLKISLALVTGDGVALGVNSMLENAKKALVLSERGYIPPPELPSPGLTVTQGFKSATLRWGPGVGAINPFTIWDDSNKLAQSYPPNHWRRSNPPCGQAISDCAVHRCDEGGRLPGGRIFAGYRLYRSEDPSDYPLPSSFALVREYIYPDGGLQKADWDSIYIDTNLQREKRYWYSVTSIGLPDIAVMRVPLPGGSLRYDTLYTENSESDILENATKVDVGFSPSESLGEVLVVPNPFRGDADYTSEGAVWTWAPSEEKVKFIHLPAGEWTIHIFALSGDMITTIRNVHEDAGYRDDRGEVDWMLLSESGRAIASGVYVFTVESKYGLQTGKFVVIR